MAAGESSVVVVGATTWGAALAIILARRGVAVTLLARTDDEAASLAAAGEHARLPGHTFPSNVKVAADASCVAAATAVIFAVPSVDMRWNAQGLATHWREGAIAVSAAKGLERGTLRRMSEVLAEALPGARVCALSGPNLAAEVVAGRPATSVVASDDDDARRTAQEILNSQTFRVYTNNDLVGTELGGALKNIIAIGAGLADGMEVGDNAKAAFVNRGLAEITRLGVAAGAQPQTFGGLAGMGDLIATCYSPLSRNHRLGLEIASGKSLPEALAVLGGEVAEGANTTPVALEMAAGLGVEMPIAYETNRVLFEGLDPRKALEGLMARTPRPEGV